MKMPTVQAAVKKETKRLAVMTFICCLLELVAYLVLKFVFPDSVSFNWKIVLSALIGWGVAVLDFFLMGLMVQRAASDSENAKSIVKASFRNRTLLRILWGVLAFVLPCFDGIAGIVPLIFPSFCVRILGFTGKA